MKPIDIVPADLEIVRQILQDFVPEIEIRAFGSRVTWSARETSDLDLALMTDDRLSDSCSMNLREAFSESELPFKVDLIDWATTSDNFRKVIEREYVVVQVGDKETSYSRISTVTNNWLYQPQFKKSWQRKPLYSLAKWVNGLAFKNIKFSSTGMPIIKIAEMKNGISGQTKFTQQTFDDSVHVRAGDMIFSWSGQPETSINVFWWRGAEGWLNQHLFRVTPIDSIDPTFFYYLLRYLRPNFIGIARNKQTTGLGHVTKRDLEAIEAAYPARPEQRAIANILGTLDDKIELNRQTNETLQAIARALFKSWFVDFDPVRAKMEGHPPAGISPELAALFPDSFEDSELGKIPKGWSVATIGKEFKLTMGQSPPGNTYNEKGDGFPFFQGRRDFGFRFPSKRVFCNSPTRFAEVGDTLVSVRAPVGDINIAYEKCAIGRGVSAIHHKSGSDSYTYYAMGILKSKFSEFEAEGTVFGSINKLDFLNIKILAPSSDVIVLFDKFIDPLDRLIRSNATTSASIVKIRETILPKLISGESTENANF